MLWMALSFPQLPLERLQRTRPDRGSPPLAVTDTRQGRTCIEWLNRAARACGVEAGMEVGAARALCGKLEVCARDLDGERQNLHSLAAWAGQFTPRVCLQPSHGLLLEVGGSLQLFGGAGLLRTRVRAGLRQLGYRPRIALAPAPLGAWLLSRAGEDCTLTELPQLARRIRALPIHALERSEHVLTQLRGMGLDTVGDCLRLPREALGRRLGPEFLRYLDRALGRLPDPRQDFQAPERFQNRMLLPTEVEDAPALLFAAHRLLLELGGFLLGRGGAVQELELRFYHRGRPATVTPLRLLGPSRDMAHLGGLLRERLERHALAAPVEALELRSGPVSPLAPQSGDLFGQNATSADLGARLIERLQARLGTDAVRGVAGVADHRPEQAWRFCPPGEGAAALSGTPLRPCWLLPRPQPLSAREGRPWLDGPLQFQAGPERIEQGWWDGHDAARDYFVAENPRHERYWIYHELRAPRGWFLHGIFA